MLLEATLDIFATGTAEGAEKAWDTRGRGRHVSKKAARALQSYVPMTKDKLVIATLNEAIVAKLVGGIQTTRKAEFDVLIDKKHIGIEVKTVFPGVKHSKITQHPESLERKHMYMQAEKIKKAYTVIFDMRDSKVYVAQGLGSFRFDRSDRVEQVNLKDLGSKIK